MASPTSPPPTPDSVARTDDRPLSLGFRGVSFQFLNELVNPTPAEPPTKNEWGAPTPTFLEVACFATRGERKSWATFASLPLHADRHHAAGFPLPTIGLCVMDTWESHREKTIVSLRDHKWGGCWDLRDRDRLAVFRCQGTELVHLNLVGIEDEGAIDRVRREMHFVHFDEAAPAAVLVRSKGISEIAWTTAITSLRLPTYRKFAALTENYPDEDHWTWERFVTRQHPGSTYFRIPPKESCSPEQWAENERALQGRPDLLRRLVYGEPGSVALGDPVTPGYREAIHLSRKPIPVAGGPLYLGWDAYHHPAVTLASLSSLGQLRIHLARRLDLADVGQLAEDLVRPWLARHGLTTRPLIHTGDSTGFTGDQSDRARCAAGRILQVLGGQWRTVGNEPEDRFGGVRSWLKRALSTGEPALLLGPEALELHKALSGGWHLGPSGRAVKAGIDGQHSHVGDACGYLCLSLTGPMGAHMHLGSWARQSAYTQPWDGAPVGSRSPSPVLEGVGNFPGFDRDLWAQQFEGKDGPWRN